jgi:predicted metal-dependent enzyme (double-stranded beta helix superfamily)
MTQLKQSSFNLDSLVEVLKTASRAPEPVKNIKAIMDQVFLDPVNIAKHMPSFTEDDVIIHEDESVSIWHCRFQPGVSVPPHNHQMTATIGVYAGEERNTFYRAGSNNGLVRDNAVDMVPGNVLSLKPSDIHSVRCTSEQPSCGIHVYLGPLSRIERSLFDWESGEAMPFTESAYEQLKRGPC